MKTTTHAKNHHDAGNAFPRPHVNPAGSRDGRPGSPTSSARLRTLVMALCISAAFASRSQAVSFSEALDSSGLDWNTGGDVPWEAIRSASHDGDDSARSGVIASSQQTWVETTVEGPGNLSFWWKVSSEKRCDHLRLLVDGKLRTSLSGDVDWTLKSCFIPPGSHTLRWRYEKDKTDSSGDDAAGLDQVVFEQTPEIVLERLDGTDLADGSSRIDFGITKLDGTRRSVRPRIRNAGVEDLSGLTITIDGANAGDFSVSNLAATSLAASGSTTFKIHFKPKGEGERRAVLHITSNDADESPFDITLTGTGSIPLPKALDAPNLNWRTGGNSAWLGQSTVNHDGADAARSGRILNFQESRMETTVTGPGDLGFWCKISSEAGYDYLEFYLDGVLQNGRISGIVDWNRKTYSIPAGEHTLRWRYTKDRSLSFGDDAAWVDRVKYSPIPQ